MLWIKAFVAGFLATLLFHQPVIGLFHALGAVPAPPYNMTPVPPLGVPQVVSLAFWGGLWGLPLWALIRICHGKRYWLRALLFGAAAPTAVAMLVVFPLKSLPVSTQTVIGGLIVNGAWGIGVAIIMWLIHRRQARQAPSHPH